LPEAVSLPVLLQVLKRQQGQRQVPLRGPPQVPGWLQGQLRAPEAGLELVPAQLSTSRNQPQKKRLHTYYSAS